VIKINLEKLVVVVVFFFFFRNEREEQGGDFQRCALIQDWFQECEKTRGPLEFVVICAMRGVIFHSPTDRHLADEPA
jgi:hypothetical protein